MCSSPSFYQQLACSRLLLLLESLCARKTSVGPHPAIEALFESKDNREAHNKEGNTPANGPEVALRLVCIRDPLKIHSEVRLQVLGVSNNLWRWALLQGMFEELDFLHTCLPTHILVAIKRDSYGN